MRLTPHGRTRRTARSVGLIALLAVSGATAVATAPAASAATAASTASLTVDAPLWVRGEGNSTVYFGSLRIDNGTSVTCVKDYEVVASSPRAVVNTTYKVTAGTTYGISAWQGGRCDRVDPQTDRRPQSLGGVTVTPGNADVASGAYRVRIG